MRLAVLIYIEPDLYFDQVDAGLDMLVNCATRTLELTS